MVRNLGNLSTVKPPLMTDRVTWICSHSKGLELTGNRGGDLF